MGDVIGLEDEFFTEESYREFQGVSPLVNCRLRDKDATIFDALLSPEADFTKSPQAEEIITAVREYGGKK